MSTALYRRYRPETFAEVIGQDHVTAPLMQALRSGRVNHAYLFSGPRGCGKTTSARILARTLNCARNTPENPLDTPCGECASCVELARGGPGSLDVVEIDAASHNGVDDARELRERAAFAPARDRYKIFILDEAHMVTPQGFNALLKLVEEPPEHVKFVFATTEPDKVIGTIRSRTHHYPFRLVPPDVLGPYLEELCAAEGVGVGSGVFPLVTRAGGGSVRDSLSVMDQLIAGAENGQVDYERAVALLGYTHATLLDDVVDALAARDGASIFRVVDQVIATGHEPRRFVEDVLERLRDLIVIAVSGEEAQAVLRDHPADQLARMRTQAQNLGMAELSRAADLVNAALTEMSGATSPRLHLELLVARLLLPGADDGSAGFAARLDRLERGGLGAASTRLAPAAPAPARTVPDAAPAAPAPVAASSGLTGAAAVRAALGRAGGAAAPVPAPTAAPSEPAPAAAPPDASAPAGPSGPVDGRAAEPAPSDDRPSGAPAGGAGPAGRARDDERVAAADEAPAPDDAPDETPAPDDAPDDAPAPDEASRDEGPAVGTADEDAAPAATAAAPVDDAPAARSTRVEPDADASGTAPGVGRAEQAGSAGPSSAEPAAPAPGGAAPAMTTEELRRRWPEVLETLSASRATWSLVSMNAQVSELHADVLFLAFPSAGLARTFSSSRHTGAVQDAVYQTLGLQVRVEARLAEEGHGGGGPAPDEGPGGPGGAPRRADEATAPAADVRPTAPAPEPVDPGPAEPTAPGSSSEAGAAVEPVALGGPRAASVRAAAVGDAGGTASRGGGLALQERPAAEAPAAPSVVDAADAAWLAGAPMTVAAPPREDPALRGAAPAGGGSAVDAADEAWLAGVPPEPPADLDDGPEPEPVLEQTRAAAPPAAARPAVVPAAAPGATPGAGETRPPGARETPRQAAERREAERRAAARGAVTARAAAEDDLPSADDPDITSTGLVGAQLVVKLLDGKIVEEIQDPGV